MIFIWLNPTYIIPNFVGTQCKFTALLVKHWVITNGPLYEVSFFCSISSENDFISNFIAVVNSVSIFVDIILINLRLLLLIY